MQCVLTTLQGMHLWEPGFKDRIHVIAGDISKPDFGLSSAI